MTNTEYEKALKEAEKLEHYEEPALYEQLGLRLLDVYNEGGYERSKQYSAEFSETAADMGVTDNLLDFGRRWWRNLEPQLMEMLCEKKHPELMEITKGKNIPQIAASLATAVLVSSLSAPAWLIVATTILAKKIAQSGLDTLCEEW